MGEKNLPVLFVTANVGSIFEDPSVMLSLWMEEFLSTVSKLDPKFLALHCQEVGGKNYEQSMKHVEYFVRLLMSSEELRLFDKVRVYLDEDFSSAENFTALGNFYFIHESIKDILLWDFKEFNFVPVDGKGVHSGNIENITTKEKSKFPQDFFPECKWSRKGFLRTRWNIKGTVFDLVNIHLFHDASNFVAMETFPSVYCKTRQRALEYTLDRFHNDEFGSAPFFLFGDFNFRTDTQGVIKKLANGLAPVYVNNSSNKDHTKLLYRDESSQIILTLGKKEFNHHDHQNLFIENAGEWLKEFDHELQSFQGQLFEYPIKFAPSYPYQEDAENGHAYMTTRCPAWCDRVILSDTAKHLVNNRNDVEYGSIGENTCMGDHKPVYLRLDLLSEAGRVVCCSIIPSVLHESPSPLNTEIIPNEERPCLVDKNVDVDPTNSVVLCKYLPANPFMENNIADLSNTKHSSFITNNSDISIKSDVFDVSSLSDSIIMLPGPSDKDSCADADSEKSFTIVNGSGKNADEKKSKKNGRNIIKRIQSSSFAEVRPVNSMRQKTCRCFSESQSWRARSESITSRSTTLRSNSKVKLISDSNLKSSLVRLQSHHSSSDEDWFEEINDESPFKEEKRFSHSLVSDDKDFKVSDETNTACGVDVEKTSVPKTVYGNQNIPETECFQRKNKHKIKPARDYGSTDNRSDVNFEPKNCCSIS